MKYKKIVKLTTGITTKIAKSMEGRVDVEFETLPVFDQKIELCTK